MVGSGIYARFGTERKDLITEATAQEFRNWMALQGFNISFMSDGTLNGDFFGAASSFWQWEIRLAFIRDIEILGVKVYKEKKQWEDFQAIYQEEAQRRYG